MGMLDWLSYPRSYLVSLFSGVYTLVLSNLVVLFAVIGIPRRAIHRFIQYTWARAIIWLAGVSVDVRGEEHLPMTGGFLALFNHTSHFDILTLYAYMPRPVCFGAKIELFKVPFFGKAMTAMGAIPIDRAKREKVLELYRAAIPRMQAGEGFALAPEGTRQKDPTLGKFKFGPFLFAIQAQMIIVPVVIAGAYDVLPKNSIWFNLGRWHRQIVLKILPPVSTEGLKDSEIETLQEKVHFQMKAELERLKEEFRTADTTLARNR